MFKKMVSLSLVCCLMMPISGFAGSASQTTNTTKPAQVQVTVLTEAQKKELAKKEKEWQEKEKIEKAKLEKAKLEIEKLLKEKKEREKLDMARAEKEKLENERLEKEKQSALKLSQPFYVTKQFKSGDGLLMTADYYEPAGNKVCDTLVITFHRAGWSRGEYKDIAGFLSGNGLAVLAPDLRSGSYINGTINETAALAVEKKLPQNFPDSLVDMEATIDYATKTLGYKKVILWGSSYSSCLNLISASKHSDIVKGVISFSPGEYFEFDGKKIAYYAEKLTMPAFIATAPFEKIDSEPIFNALIKNNPKNQFYISSVDNLHGSSMLWNNIPLTLRKDLWGKILGFIGSLDVQITDKAAAK